MEKSSISGCSGTETFRKKTETTETLCTQEGHRIQESCGNALSCAQEAIVCSSFPWTKADVKVHSKGTQFWHLSCSIFPANGSTWKHSVFKPPHQKCYWWIPGKSVEIFISFPAAPKAASNSSSAFSINNYPLTAKITEYYSGYLRTVSLRPCLLLPLDMQCFPRVFFHCLEISARQKSLNESSFDCPLHPQTQSQPKCHLLSVCGFFSLTFCGVFLSCLPVQSTRVSGISGYSFFLPLRRMESAWTCTNEESDFITTPAQRFRIWFFTFTFLVFQSERKGTFASDLEVCHLMVNIKGTSVSFLSFLCEKTDITEQDVQFGSWGGRFQPLTSLNGVFRNPDTKKQSLFWNVFGIHHFSHHKARLCLRAWLSISIAKYSRLTNWCELS